LGYNKKNPDIQLVTELADGLHLTFKMEQFPQKKYKTYIPDIVDDLSNRKFFILEPETYVPEIAVFLILTFCLSMLCRYFPDIWVKTIDESVKIAEITDSLLNIDAPAKSLT